MRNPSQTTSNRQPDLTLLNYQWRQGSGGPSRLICYLYNPISAPGLLVLRLSALTAQGGFFFPPALFLNFSHLRSCRELPCALACAGQAHPPLATAHPPRRALARLSASACPTRSVGALRIVCTLLSYTVHLRFSTSLASHSFLLGDACPGPSSQNRKLSSNQVVFVSLAPLTLRS